MVAWHSDSAATARTKVGSNSVVRRRYCRVVVSHVSLEMAK